MDFDPRDHDSRERDGQTSHDPRGAFMRNLYLPNGAEREVVRDRDHGYSLRGSETRTLPRSGRFQSSRRAGCATTVTRPPIRVQATPGICASKA
jgi:hypothetical protein